MLHSTISERSMRQLCHVGEIINGIVFKLLLKFNAVGAGDADASPYKYFWAKLMRFGQIKI